MLLVSHGNNVTNHSYMENLQHHTSRIHDLVLGPDPDGRGGVTSEWRIWHAERLASGWRWRFAGNDGKGPWPTPNRSAPALFNIFDRPDSLEVSGKSSCFGCKAAQLCKARGWVHAEVRCSLLASHFRQLVPVGPWSKFGVTFEMFVANF